MPQVSNHVEGIAEILLLVPMPWRAGILIVLVGGILFWVMCRPIAWLLMKPLPWTLRWTGTLLLLPTGSINVQLRSRWGRVLPGSVVYENLVGGIFGLTYTSSTRLGHALALGWLQRRTLSLVLLVSLAALPIGTWYIRPALGETVAARYVDNGIDQWALLEQQLFPEVHAASRELTTES